MLSVREGEAHKKDWANTPLPELVKGNAMDTFYTLRIFRELEGELDKLDANKINDLVYAPLTNIFAKVEREGMEVDLGELENVKKNLDKTIIDIEDKLYAIPEVRPSDNLSSTLDLRKVLYSEEGFGFYAPKFTGKELPSTDKETLEELLSQIEEELDSRA